MEKHKLKTAAVCALAAVFLFCATAFAAGEAPAYSDAAVAAAPQVTALTETIEQGEHFAVRVELGAGSVAAAAAVRTSGLQFLYTSSEALCTQNELMLLRQLPSVVYHYKVTAAPQDEVIFALGGTVVLLTEDGEEEPAPQTVWTGRVSGTRPRPTPGPTTEPLPTVRPQGPLVVSGSAGLSVEGEVMTHKELEVTVSTTADGLDAELDVRGMEFMVVDNAFCSPSRVVLVKGESGSVTSATYTFVVTAEPGEEVSVNVRDVTLSVNGADEPGHSSAWINWVPDGQSAPTATPTREPGGHTFTLSAGLSMTALPSGRTLVVGRNADRTGQSVQDFLTGVHPPAGGRVEVVSPQEKVLSGSALITTGCEVRVYDSAGALADQAVVGLRGDVCGSGVLDVAQLVQTARYLNGSRTPTELQEFCADVSRNGRVDITDLISMASALREV